MAPEPAYFLNDGGQLRDISGSDSKLLGHTSLKTTAIYYKISDSRVDEEMNKMQ